MADTVNLTIRKDDRLLLIGILEHAMAQGEKEAFEHWRLMSGIADENVQKYWNETASICETLARWVAALKAS